MEVKDYKPGDERAIIQLFELVFGKPMSLEYWTWRFANNPCEKLMIKLMWDGDKLVGHYAASPVQMHLHQKLLLTGLSMTTMTHPDYTGLGIFQQLSESLYEKMGGNDNAAAVWGFPNNNSHRGFIKNLAWKDISILPMFSCNNTLLRPKQLEGAKVTDRFSKVHEEAYQTNYVDYAVRINKNSAYLNWRYVDNPVNEYKIFDFTELNAGFVVCKEYTAGNDGMKQVDIIDWCVPADEKMTRNVIQHLAAFYPAANYSQFNMWMPLGDERHLQLEKLGFANHAPVTYWGIRTLQGSDLSAPGDWWIQLGDSDVY
ncbi:GNAT family N-acetyltransferase [Chitinophaga ginsengisegetis]|uniref:GNAT family N-acetyltransferase n=1 Tax=Chitinophaga ginsengisegetis TaxID=393003 RepID=UPI0034289B58